MHETTRLYLPQPIEGDLREARLRERDRLIAVRWWWLSHHLKLRTSYVLEVMSQREFYMHERSILRIVDEQSAVLKSMKEYKPTAREISKHYPSFVWAHGASV